MAPTFTVRKSVDRGHANLGWLDTHHTFSFANYYDPKFDGFGSLRVLNEDKVKPGKGFGAHPHQAYEIFSYVVDGQLEHKDSAGHHEIVGRGNIQFTTAGTGIAHSEYNASQTDPVHFLQIWNLPSNTRLRPGYATGNFPDSCKKNQFATLIAPENKRDAVQPTHPDASKPIAIHSDFWMSAALLDPGIEIVYRTPELGQSAAIDQSEHSPRRLYLHLVQNNPRAKLTVSVPGSTDSSSAGETTLSHGDGMFVNGFDVQSGGLVVRNDGQGVAEVVLMDLA
ncbi:hypothetical protein HDU93_006281 [Gonapodya sp. JEL0774]|nr:hypothetical protein HDU93_006281 [Gonapodya sp. JEL0774]